ncbi:MAG: hypothetical protein ACQKBV_09870 [Puniceicoccales bacterium]
MAPASPTASLDSVHYYGAGYFTWRLGLFSIALLRLNDSRLLDGLRASTRAAPGTDWGGTLKLYTCQLALYCTFEFTTLHVVRAPYAVAKRRLRRRAGG